jgi:hypothetical protein
MDGKVELFSLIVDAAHAKNHIVICFPSLALAPTTINNETTTHTSGAGETRNKMN